VRRGEEGKRRKRRAEGKSPLLLFLLFFPLPLFLSPASMK
jgi:hypothetical protein